MIFNVLVPPRTVSIVCCLLYLVHCLLKNLLTGSLIKQQTLDSLQWTMFYFPRPWITISVVWIRILKSMLRLMFSM